MDPFRLCIALGPVAVYLLLLGLVNLGRRPLVVNGTRDAAALGMALAGFIIVGPIELFFPYGAAARFGPAVWLLLLALYAMCLILVLLWLRPRLVIYNLTVDQLRPVLGELIERVDPEARWAGDTLSLPGLGVQLHIEFFAALRNTSLVAIGNRQSPAGWRRLELVLIAALNRLEVGPNPRGASLVGMAVLIFAAVSWRVAMDPQAVARAVLDMLHLS